MQDYIPEWRRSATPAGVTPEESMEVAASGAISGDAERVAAVGKAGEKGAWEVWKGSGAERIPFVGTAKQFDDMAELLMMARRAERGKASQRDLQVLNNWVADQQRGHTFGGTVVDIGLSIPQFAIELLASAGIGKAAVTVGGAAGKEATKALIFGLARSGALKATKAAALKEGLKKARNKAVAATAKRSLAGPLTKRELGKRIGINALRGTAKTATIVGAMEATGQAAAHLIGREDKGGIISAGAASKALGRIEWKEDEFGRFRVAMDQAIPGTLELLPQGFVGAMIEVGTELAGGALARGAKGAWARSMQKFGVEEIPLITNLQALQMKAAERWLGKGGKNTMDRLLEIAEAGKFNGILGEFLEERAVGVAQLAAGQVSGWEEDFDGMDALLPGWTDAAAELTAFSLVPGAAMGIAAAEQYKITRDEATMTQEELTRTRLARRKAKEGDRSAAAAIEGADALGDLGPLEERDILLEDASYDIEGGLFTPEEFRQYQEHITIAGGEALRVGMPEIGNGLRGVVGEPQVEDSPAFKKDPSTVLKIQEIAESITGMVFREGREENIEQDKAAGRRPKDVAIGVDVKRKLAGMLRSKNVPEMVRKMTAILEQKLLRGDVQIREGESAEDAANRAIIEGLTVGGRAGLSRAASVELQAVGSVIHRGLIQKPLRRVRGLEKAIVDLINRDERNRDTLKHKRLKDDLKEAELEVRRIEALHRLGGLQQFMQLALTAGGTKQMPKTTEWFRDTFAANHPQVYGQLRALQAEVTRFRIQGTEARIKAQSSDVRNPLTRMKNRWELISTSEGRRKLLDISIEETIDSNLALRALAARMEIAARKDGRDLKTSENPLLMSQIFSGMAEGTLHSFLYEKVVSFGQKVRRDVLPLVAVGEFVKGRVEAFGNYLWARRAIALYEDVAAKVDKDGNLIELGGAETSRKRSAKSVSRDAGMSYEDAKNEVENAPVEFMDAADIYYQWWDAVLDFLAESSESGATLVREMRFRDPGEYIGIFRELGEEQVLSGKPGTIMDDVLGANATKKLTGGMELVGPVWEGVTGAAKKMFDMAFLGAMNQAIANGLQMDGMQDMGNILAPDQVVVKDVKVRELIERVAENAQTQAQRAAAEDRRAQGLPAEEIDADALGRFMGAARGIVGDDMSEYLNMSVQFMADSPVVSKGDGRRVIPFVNGDGKMMYMDLLDDGLVRWYDYKLTPDQVGTLWAAAALHKKIFTFSATTGRVLFQAFRNPVRDLGTSIINTRTSGAARLYLQEGLRAIWAEWTRAFKGGKPINEWQETFITSALTFSSELSQDSFGQRAMVHRISGRPGTKIENGWNWILNMLEAPERGVRTTELKLYAQEMLEANKLESMDELSKDQMFDIILAAKRVSTNFTVSGRFTGKWNQVIPFLNAQIQGPRDTIRAILADGDVDRRREKLVRAAAYYTMPALLAWLFVKDEDWYIELTPEERANSWYFPVGGGEWLTLPLPFEIGTVFSAMPVLLADAAYRENKEETEWFVSKFVAAGIQAGGLAWDTLPGGLPPVVNAMRDLYTNKKSYWGTPIVSDSMKRLEEKAQYDEFTTHLARWIGSSAGELGINDGSGWSPKMIDHAVKSLFGPMGMDAFEVLGGGTDASEIGGFRSLPIVGKQFKEELAYPVSVTELYETYNKVQKRFDTKIHEESEDEMDVRLAMRDAIKSVSAISLMLRRATGEFRDQLKEERLSIARAGLAIHRDGHLPEEQRVEMRERRKELEKEKKALRQSIIDERKESLGD